MKINNHPKITVITPSLNQGRFIREMIDSVLLQNYPNLEFIIMDGGSTDQTIEILKSYGGRLRWKSEADGGQSDAINKGLKLAQGEILTYLNADDVMLPNTLHTVSEVFTDKHTQWLTGDYFIIDENGNKIQEFVAIYKKALRSLKKHFLLKIVNYVIQPSTFWRRELTEKFGGFDNNLRYCMDYDMWLRFLQVSDPIIVPHHFSLFRIHSQSKGGSQYVKQFTEEVKVGSKYCKNILINVLHWIHAQIIILIYKIIK